VRCFSAIRITLRLRLSVTAERLFEAAYRNAVAFIMPRSSNSAFPYDPRIGP
jgi:hypothetical protein